jgi:hypothetical protein
LVGDGKAQTGGRNGGHEVGSSDAFGPGDRGTHVEGFNGDACWEIGLVGEPEEGARLKEGRGYWHKSLVLMVPGGWPQRERYRSAVFMARARVVPSTAGLSELAPKRW